MSMINVPAALVALAGAPITRRGLAKLRTREALLAAAKKLITERGYEEATVRDIAKAAGMSTGAVFANVAGYAFHLKQLPLLQAACAEGWRQDAAGEVAMRDRMRQIIAILEGILRQATADGELRSEIDVDLAVDLIFRAYQSNYRLAIYDGFDLEALTGRLERQLDLILPSMTFQQAA